MTTKTLKGIAPFLLAILSFSSLSMNGARADVFSSNSTKHPEPRTSPAEDFAKFKWLGDESDQAVTVNRIVISLVDQRLYAYHDRNLLGWSNVSSGRAGHETPTGAFAISQKDVDHHSSLYDDASMPFFMRLTDTGVGLHAGFLPGYPASHGCVRLPLGMARELYQRADAGTPVEILPTSFNADETRHAAAITSRRSQLESNQHSAV